MVLCQKYLVSFIISNQPTIHILNFLLMFLFQNKNDQLILLLDKQFRMFKQNKTDSSVTKLRNRCDIATSKVVPENKMLCSAKRLIFIQRFSKFVDVFVCKTTMQCTDNNVESITLRNQTFASRHLGRLNRNQTYIQTF